MSDTYVTMKVREALAGAQGSRSQALRLLVAWALADEQLLRGLCKPFLPAIAGSAIERIARGTGAPASSPVRSTGAKSPTKRKLSPQVLDAIISRMGQSGPGPMQLGQGPDAPGADDPPHQADALKTLAAAFKQRR